MDQGQAIKFALDIAKGMAYFHTLEPLITGYILNSFHVVVSVAYIPLTNSFSLNNVKNV